MPMMTLNRDLAVYEGIWTVTFKKGEPTFVPDPVVRAALAAGAIASDAQEAKQVEQAVAVEDAKEVPSGDLRARQIRAALEDIRNGNNPEDFTATGIPSDAALTATLGYSISRKEREEAWKALIGKE